ncbi:uncharacterized protein KY384_007939 [Bacidia gigantensis]|uniref:uncharacterized protein n=1 Tax=Bacidia gigantensis TaxID=2732470 RepID=UPI001D040EEE|nr:uncharacterized protein KY384_007939 [Bacidia gigantensis]KAG8527785.1 hypothetical protein KY384_007939 [Bacidia gigantensis]
MTPVAYTGTASASSVQDEPRSAEQVYASPLPTNSALRFESAAYYPEDILCPGSDEELSEQERAMKRRRVVQRGEEYLAGHAPFMMTAGLNGPFDNSWENPWAKKRSEGKTVNVDRVERASAAMRSNPPRLLHSEEYHQEIQWILRVNTPT